MPSVFLGFTDYLLTGINWYRLLITTLFVILAGCMAFGPDGARVPDGTASGPSSPRVPASQRSSQGHGRRPAVLGRGGADLPLRVPPGVEGGTPAAARQALVITTRHWGLHA